jgi:hypothetical protein
VRYNLEGEAAAEAAVANEAIATAAAVVRAAAACAITAESSEFRP